ncbi:glycosyltransferase family 2 protein [Marivita geojedonensis]|uniref:glycosyltransferase family 2 protein n=1 Tax=Marivita geojedonensis TaxID=1123756 RepID=UPI000A1FC9DE|nr:glycosyltransferase family A protein [Marivita geojedonensis]PRY81485.1 GT2 family glycosyltransferase [Marivita geojedonensis]
MRATVVITTKNRRDSLRVALASCTEQTARPEILVIDDGSTDGTSEMVSAEFPQVYLLRHEASAGLIVRRNEAFRKASGDIIFSIDDDAEFSSIHTVRQTLADFDDPRIAGVAIPLIEPKYAGRRLQFPPNSSDTWITDCFKGTAFAVRRETFLSVGGFREDLVHQGEETDFAIRLLDQDFLIRLGRADPIIHYESPIRDLRRMHFYGRRNDILFAFRNVPTESVPLHLLGTTWNGIKSMVRAKQPHDMAYGLLVGWLDGIRLLNTRCPVSKTTYRLYRRLRSTGSMRRTDF